MPFDLQEFQNPSKQYRPFVRWWWPGLAVTKEEILSEIKQIDDAGFGGFEIQPFLIGGSGGKPPEETHRMAPHPFFFEIMEIVLEESKKRNLIVDLNIGSSWPPGGTHIETKNSLKTLFMGTQIIKGPQKACIPVPPYQLNPYYKYPKIMSGMMGHIQNDFSEYINKFKLVSVVAVKPIKKSSKLNFIFPKATPLQSDNLILLTEYINEENKIDWDVPEGVWQIFSFYGGPTGMKPMNDSRSAPDKVSRVVDIFDKDAVTQLMEGFVGVTPQNLGKILPYGGNPLRAFFTDSQEIAGEWFWTEKLFSVFKSLRGYDIRPYLPAIFMPNHDNQFLEVFFQNDTPCYNFPKDDIGNKVRYDWYMTLSDIWSSDYIEHISKWGSKYNILHRIQTYGLPVDVLKTFGAADIPETEVLFAGSIDFFRIAGSAGIIYEKPIVSCESFSWNKKDLMTNPIKWKVTCDRLFVSGINQNVFHGWTYQTVPLDSETKSPGRYPWRSHWFAEDLGPLSPFWNYYPILNDYTTRGQYSLSQGTTEVNVGLFFQEFNYTYKNLSGEDNEEGSLPGYDSERVKGPIAWFKRKPRSDLDKKCQLVEKVGQNLTENGYYYVHINEDAIDKSNIVNGKLCIGSAKLDILIIPEYKSIPSVLIQKMDTLVKQGIKILFYGCIPETQSGLFNYIENEELLSRNTKQYMNNGIFSINKKQDIGKFLLDALKIETTIAFDKPEEKIWFIKKKIGDDQLLFVRSGDFNERDIGFRIKSENKYVYSLDLWTGNIRNYPALVENESISIKLRLPSYGSKLFLISNEKINGIFELDSDGYIQPLLKTIQLNKWHLNVKIPDMNNNGESWESDLSTLQDWRNIKEIQYCSGSGTYSSSFTIDENFIDSINRFILDLGRVQDVATLIINGKEVGTSIVPPYKFDITSYVKKNLNLITVKVQGTLLNERVGFGKKYAGEYKVYEKRKQLMPVGMIGPVRLEIHTSDLVE